MKRGSLVVTRWSARFAGRSYPCATGRGGIRSAKVEGDGATPAGRMIVTGCFFRPDRVAFPPPWAIAIGPKDIWCDDVSHPLYNLHAKGPLAASHESLRRADPLYDLILTTDWNWPLATPGKGSAIFIHRWRKPRHPTEGCIAFHPGDLLALAHALTPGTQIVTRP